MEIYGDVDQLRLICLAAHTDHEVAVLQGVVAVLLLGDIHVASVHLGLLAEEVDSAVLPVEVDLHVGAVGGVILVLHQGFCELEGTEGAEHGAVVVVGHEYPALVGSAAVETQHLLLFVKLQTEGLLGGVEGGVSAGADVDSHTLEGKLLVAIGQGGGAMLVDVLGGDVAAVVGVDIQTGHGLCVGFRLGNRLGGQGHDLGRGIGLGVSGPGGILGLHRLIRVGGLGGLRGVGGIGGIIPRQGHRAPRDVGGGCIGRVTRRCVGQLLRGVGWGILADAGGQQQPHRHQHQQAEYRRYPDFSVFHGTFHPVHPFREAYFTSTPQTAPAHP